MSEQKELKNKILVIGASGIKSADRCFNWLQPYDDLYIGNFDTVIINTQSLSKEILGKIKNTGSNILAKIKEELLELIRSGRNERIICISSPYISSSQFSVPYSGEREPLYSNYSWCPIEFEPISKNITELENKTDVLEEYFVNVKKSDHYFNYNVSIDWLDKNMNFADLSWESELEPLITSRVVNKPIAFKLVLRAIHPKLGKDKPLFEKRRFFVVPPTTGIETEEGVELLVKILKGIESEIPTPEWTNKVTLPGIDKLQEENIKDLKTIETLSAKIKERDQIIKSLAEYKRLLFTDGRTLEDIVEKTLGEFGIKLGKPSVDNIEDRFFKRDEMSIPIEIKSCNKSANADHIGQLLSRLSNKHKGPYKTQGLLILNHFRNMPPDKRGEAFPNNIVITAKQFDIGLITTLDIYNLLCKKIAGEDVGDIESKLFNTVGVYK